VRRVACHKKFFQEIVTSETNLSKETIITVIATHNPMVIGKHLYLRPLEPDQDAGPLAKWASHEEMRQFFNVYPMSMAMYKDRISQLYKDTSHILLGVACKEDPGLCGIVGLKAISQIHRSAEFYIKIDQACQGRGYGTEATILMLRYAFVDLNLNRVQTQDVEVNVPGWKVDEKVGFRLEGIAREAFFRSGDAYDVRVYSLLRQEYLEQVQKNPIYTLV
jgi:RimJ/RimL family protein N-acetyltransferase